MVVNFRARGISRGTRKLARTPTLNLKKKKKIDPCHYYPSIKIKIKIKSTVRSTTQVLLPQDLKNISLFKPSNNTVNSSGIHAFCRIFD